MKILIVEPDSSGHRPNYVALFAKSFDYSDYQVEVVTQSGQSSKFHAALNDIALKCVAPRIHEQDLSWLSAHGGGLLRQIGTWQFYRTAVGQFAGGNAQVLIIVPYIDAAFWAMAIMPSPFRGHYWSGVMMRTAALWVPSRLQSGLFVATKKFLLRKLLLSKKLKRLFMPDAVMVSGLRSNRLLAPRVGLIKEPSALNFDNACSQPAARAKFGIADGSKVVLLYGAISLRKGLRALLDGLSEPEFDDMVLLAVGRHTAEARSLISDKHQLWGAGRVVSIDQYVTSETAAAAFRAADIVWLGYNNHDDMSAVLVDAARSGRPVVARRRGLIAWHVERSDAGVLFDADGEVAGALQQALAIPRHQMNHAIGYFRDYSVDNFTATVREGVRLDSRMAPAGG